MDRSALFDTHVHLLDNRLEWLLDGLDDEAGGMICVFEPGENAALFRQLVDRPNIWGVAGVHPHNARHYTKMEKDLIGALELQGVVGLGEIGLDYYYDNSPRDIQRKVFEKQLELAADMEMPVVVHTRDSFSDTIEILAGFAAGPVLIHCFPGARDEMTDCVERGFYIALGGITTFPNAGDLVEVARQVPIDRLLLETDAPYLAPQPVRGKTNRPAYLEHVARRIAEIRDMDVGDLLCRVRQNAIDFFGLSV
jgi:TatD DNase family protein